MSELCTVKETTEGISSPCIVQVIGWEEWKGPHICPFHQSGTLWGDGGCKRGTFITCLFSL